MPAYNPYQPTAYKYPGAGNRPVGYGADMMGQRPLAATAVRAAGTGVQYGATAGSSSGMTGGYNAGSAFGPDPGTVLLQQGPGFYGNGPSYNVGFAAPNGMPQYGTGWAPSLGIGGYAPPQLSTRGQAGATPQGATSGSPDPLAQLMALLGGNQQAASGGQPAPGSLTGGQDGSGWKVTPTEAQAAQGVTNPRPNDIPGFDWVADPSGGYQLKPQIPYGYRPVPIQMRNGNYRGVSRLTVTNPLTGAPMQTEPVIGSTYHLRQY